MEPCGWCSHAAMHIPNEVCAYPGCMCAYTQGVAPGLQASVGDYVTVSHLQVLEAGDGYTLTVESPRSAGIPFKVHRSRVIAVAPPDSRQCESVYGDGEGVYYRCSKDFHPNDVVHVHYDDEGNDKFIWEFDEGEHYKYKLVHA